MTPKKGMRQNGCAGKRFNGWSYMIYMCFYGNIGKWWKMRKCIHVYTYKWYTNKCIDVYHASQHIQDSFYWQISIIPKEPAKLLAKSLFHYAILDVTWGFQKNTIMEVTWRIPKFLNINILRNRGSGSSNVFYMSSPEWIDDFDECK